MKISQFEVPAVDSACAHFEFQLHRDHTMWRGSGQEGILDLPVHLRKAGVDGVFWFTACILCFILIL